MHDKETHAIVYMGGETERYQILHTLFIRRILKGFNQQLIITNSVSTCSKSAASGQGMQHRGETQPSRRAGKLGSCTALAGVCGRFACKHAGSGAKDSVALESPVKKSRVPAIS